MSSASCLIASPQHPAHICHTDPRHSTDNNDANSRKRKRNHISSQGPEELGGAFTIERKTTSNGPSLKPAKLVPRLLTSRSCLPLSYLDLDGGNDGFPGAQIFRACVVPLESNLRGNACDQPLLIATLGTQGGSLFAIEKVDAGLYALCRLGNWVTLEALDKLRISVEDRSLISKQEGVEQIYDRGTDWWRPVAVGTVHDVSKRHNKKLNYPRSDTVRLRMGVPEQPPEQSVISIEQPLLEMPPQRLETTKNFNEDGGESLQPVLSDPAEALITIRDQYHKALYLSKSSLAYFAKGPLSRARAVFCTTGSPPETSSKLIHYLRSSVLTLAIMDKKYKDVLPSIISTLPTGIVAIEDIGTVIAGLDKKNRKSKTGKIGKDGLYPGEEINVARWWLSRHGESPDSSSTNTDDVSLNTFLLEQRARETQLQIVLILEAIALEASNPPSSNDANAVDETINDGDNTQSRKKNRTKKRLDPATQLDILVDRLSIWQSMRNEDCKPAKTEDGSKTPYLATFGYADHLKSFCVDVVLPFYGARLPEVANMLCQKLGGPKAPSPMRPPLAKAASASRLPQKPGASIQAPPHRKPRRTLERVLTEEKGLQSRKPSLSRSATDSALPCLKREASDTAISLVGLNRAISQKTQRYSQREVDLKAVLLATQTKLQKKAAVERELQGAIAALKKPNPRMAVKELVEAAEKRAAGSNSRKPKNPVRSLFAQGVQVTATPRNRRQKDVFGELPRPPATTLTTADEPDEIPPSSAFRVPSSIQSAPRTKDKEPRLPRPYLQTTIEQTPTRGPLKHSKQLSSTGPGIGPSSIFLTSSKPRRALDSIPQASQRTNTQAVHSSTSWPQEPGNGDSKILETPHKDQIGASEQEKSCVPVAILSDTPPRKFNPNVAGGASAPTFPSSPPMVEGEPAKSIFEALGWDDDVDELS
ncbi:MAG: hypothetical protein Q9195_002945 [Heterodermia aff. obscurata]